MTKRHDGEAVPGAAGPSGRAAPDTATAAGGSTSTAPVPSQARSVRSREQILDATIECLLTHGYAATTTQRVQELAGVSRGRLLYHFPNKRELIAAAVARAADRRLGAVPGSTEANRSSASGAQAPTSDEIERRAAITVDELWASHSEPIFWVAVESWNAARTDPELAALTREHERSVMRRVRQTITHNLGSYLGGLPGTDTLMDVVFTSMRGVAMTYMFSGRSMATEPMLAVWKRMLADHLSSHTQS